MHIAAIYDIHGNLPALEAVLAEIREEGVDLVVVGGDVVPGPLPEESIETLLALELPVRFLHGNGEHDIVALSRGEAIPRVPERVRPTLQWVASRLSREHLAELATWPMTQRLEIPGLGRVLFCHSTPRDDFELFTRLTPEDRLRPIFGAAGADLVVCGHTHMPFERRIGSVRVVNAGSVGMPFGEPGAYWLLLGESGAEHRCTHYDFEAAARGLAAPGYPSPMVYDVRRPPPAEQMLEVFEAAALEG